jgi:hypothetical protein
MNLNDDSGSSEIRLSVLVTPTKSGGDITRTLDSLADQGRFLTGTEIIVIVPEDRSTGSIDRSAERLRGRGAFVRLVPAAPGGASQVPAWRAMAFNESKGRVCVFLEDNAAIEPGWHEAWNEMAERDDWTIATGYVTADEPGWSLVSLGVFFCEYGFFVPRSENGQSVPLFRVAGNHWAVNRSRLPDTFHPHEIDEHVWTHRFVSSGQKPAHNEQAIVRCRREIGAIEAVSERAVQGYRFGRDESLRARPVRRLKMIACGPAIVLVQFVRLAGVVALRRSHRLMLARSSHWTVGLLMAWSYSEWAGWCIGSLRMFFQTNLKNRAEGCGESPEWRGPIEHHVVKPFESAG